MVRESSRRRGRVYRTDDEPATDGELSDWRMRVSVDDVRFDDVGVIVSSDDDVNRSWWEHVVIC